MTASTHDPSPHHHQNPAVVAERPPSDDGVDNLGLVVLLEQQLAMYEKLVVLSKEQAGLVASGTSESLLGLLSKRQLIINRLAELDTKLSPYRRRWAELWADLPTRDRPRIQGLLERIQKLLGSIIEQDERDRAQLESTKESLGSELGRVHQAGAVTKAYRPPTTPAVSQFTDRQG